MKISQVSNIQKFADEKRIITSSKKHNAVKSILKNVRENGDLALKKYEKKFNGTIISKLRLTEQEIELAFSKVSKIEIAAIRLSKSKLEKTESILKSMLKNIFINNDGVKISKKFEPIRSVGCYIPGGLAEYPSSVIMPLIPAKVAGVKRIVVVSPPKKDGTIDPLTIVAAKICGADEIYRTGGAQSIAALAYGTKSIPKVDKIVGPGGSFVTIAKLLVSNTIAIDMLAGPTELGIIADNSTDPKFIALDLISQSEHSADTLCYLITNSRLLAKSVDNIITKLSKNIERKDIVSSSLQKNGFIAICKNYSEMVKLANELAPEHLQIMTKNSSALASKLTTPGLILFGNNSPSAASDYLLGSNHILPTNGFGKTRGSISVLDFLKINTRITTSKCALSKISKPLQIFTSAENLPNHFEAIKGRIK